VDRRGDMRKNAVLRGISALHAGQPIAGLRYSGKGANRTILDCSLSPVGPERGGLSAAAGVAGAGSLPVTGAVLPAAADERAWNRDDSVFGGASDTP
jgi:hypothetical protein